MKKLLFLLLVTILSFSQEKELTVAQIDSICQSNESHHATSCGQIILKSKNNKRDDFGGFSLSICSNNDNNFEKTLYLKKGIYHQIINFENHNEECFIELYYFNNKPFLCDIVLSKNRNKTLINKVSFQLNELELNLETKINNEFNLDLRDLINNTNKEILRLSEFK